ncbi:MAG: nucleotide exchange factor GrpE [candidate division Zixibacteria bacterium]|nr:nucleotide exchange factor GrpE [candidate division Zixibacteria bacterium]
MSKKNKNSKETTKLNDNDTPEIKNEKEIIAENLEQEEKPQNGGSIDITIGDNGVIFPEPADLLREAQEKYLRLAAEFDNYKKRTSREFGELIKSANRDLLLQLLPVSDHFELALNSENNDDNNEGFRKGVELIYKELQDFLQRMNVNEIKAAKETFDPNIHEAVMQVPNNEHEEGLIINETQKGYMLGDKVLRPAKVIISAGPPKDESSESEEDSS